MTREEAIASGQPYFGRVTCFETRLWAVRKTATGWENVPPETTL